MSTTSILELQIKPDRVDDALAILERILPDTRAFAGCRSVVLLQDHSDPTRLTAVETWASPADDAAYRTWRAGEGAIPELPEVLAGAPRLTVGVTRLVL